MPLLIACSLGFGVVQLDVTVVNVAIEPIGRDLGGGTAGLQWIVSAYTLALAALILSTGALGDRIGAKRMLLGGFGLFVVASAACGLAPSLTVLIAARVVQGVGAAALIPASLSVLRHAFPDEDERARAVAIWAAGASITLSAGPLVGGVLIAAIGWRAIFFINLPLGVLGAWLAARHATETPRAPDRRLDLGGQLSAIVALGALAAATIEGGAHGFAAPGVLAGYAVALAAANFFLFFERRAPDPMLPLDVFRGATFSGATAIGLLVNVGTYGLIFMLSLFFQVTQGRSELSTGLAFLPMTGAVLAANLAAPRVAARITPRRAIVAGATLALVAFLALLAVHASTPYAALVAPLVVLGLGVGLIVPPLTATQLGSVGSERSGLAAGTLNAARQTGSVLGVAVFGALGGLRAPLAIAAGCSLAVLGLTRRLRQPV